MPCSRTEHLLREYFADDLDPAVRAEIEQHVGNCPDCAGELRQLLGATADLRRWRELPPPRWHRHLALFKRERGAGATGPSGWRLAWQWLPATACALMLGLVLLNTSVVYRDGAVEIGFGSPSMAEVDRRLAEFEREQAEERASFAATLARFEQLRAQDLETIQASYEWLADRDYETVQSLRQLVSFVGSSGVATW
ncbi:MAG: zf-HC2 domain-containing protein [Gammaproteobacteria bacterium]|nr:zf-HC2 domain-containing protein [Gammaproteobacteria bacterium]